MSQIREGEEIFEYVGETCEDDKLEKIQIYRESLKATALVNNDQDGLNHANMTSEQAFEVFRGKYYHSVNTGIDHYALVGSVDRKIETPIEKFARVRSELADLQNDLTALAQVTHAQSMNGHT